ncbi:MAG: PIG-L family deacetylase [Bacteroidetes bacterium]|nr:PIG-L family deacetylase [Bacteroidota bacterium]
MICESSADSNQNLQYLLITQHNDDSKKVLFVIAHQDDDAFIISRIKYFIDCKDELFIIWTCKSYQGDSTYGNIRIKESITAMDYIGLDSTSYKFLNYPDMNSYLYVPEIVNDIKETISIFNPTEIYIQAYEMGNIDHDIAHFCTVQSLRELNYICNVFEFPQYSAYNIGELLPFELRKYPDTLITVCNELNEINKGFVIEYWKFYESQRFPMMYYFYFLGQLDNLFNLECFRKLPKYDYLKKPFNAPAAYERYLPDVTYSDFHNAIYRYLKQEEK